MKLELNTKLSPTISPQMVLSMKMLQFSAQELEEFLEELSYENPLMEVEPPPAEDFVQKMKWLGTGGAETSTREETWRPEPCDGGWQSQQLSDHLKSQILLLPISRELRRAMEILAELLSPQGFYDGTPKELAQLARVSLETAGDALRHLKTLAPTGVGAQNVRECLLIQLQGASPKNPVAERLVAQQFDHLISWPAQRLGAAVGATVQEVEDARTLIASLNPYPGDGFASRDSIHYIRPDLVVSDTPQGLSAEFCEASQPKITVNTTYLQLLNTQEDPEVQKYLREKLAQTEQVIRILGNRKSTVVRCAEVILSFQSEFFRGGSLRKMTMGDVAGELGVHESTVSRAVRGKYLQCSRGLLELSSFFSRDAGQNIGISRESIKDRLREIVREENPKKPYSDEKIAELLAVEGLSVSRRTVAKYRMELGILGASSRKQQNNVRNSDAYKNKTTNLEGNL